MSDGLNEDYVIQEGDFVPTYWVNVTTHMAECDGPIEYFWTPDDPQYFDVYYE